MTTTAAPIVDDADGAVPPPAGRSLRVVLLAVIVVAVLGIAGASGYLIGHRGQATGSSGVAPGASSVDAGFAWDMSVHHRQAIIMAGYTRDHTSDPGIKLLAYDIETSQYFQVGEMQGWIDAWRLPTNSPNAQMSWMAGSTHMSMQSDGSMPGMASPAEMNKLQTLTGKTLDTYFLQLMLRHHQGGLPMAQWAAAHAQTAYVRNLAGKMAATQSGEIVQMEQLLRESGASPLAPPS
ncbi:DUF305 domain-containing protein [Jatrophihabitans telluris]|uniref:DUF305 domain-containing protein n=1 Tax=Jatrophihabitans telluris TaxID=2038343 RepID=A0ABY4R3G4_9ACTN|nr:DUF305 domain-containing protein [Jatrophihabitans telluris]UQX89847.1 DUF305 domain-containing protein [Jatrophihabitans telluris]